MDYKMSQSGIHSESISSIGQTSRLPVSKSDRRIPISKNTKTRSKDRVSKNRRWLFRIASYATLASIIGVGAAPAFAAPTAPAGASTTSAECATSASQDHPGMDWVCFGSDLTLLTTDENGPKVAGYVPGSETDRSANNQGVTPQAVINGDYSNTTEPIVVNYQGNRYVASVNVKVALSNHSANVRMSYSSEVPLRLTWKLRIRRDNRLSFDNTVFTYSSVYGSSLPSTSGGAYEDRYGEGFNQLPYDRERYFYDLYDPSVIIGGKQINILGSVQSDRALCYKTVPCKFGR